MGSINSSDFFSGIDVNIFCLIILNLICILIRISCLLIIVPNEFSENGILLTLKLYAIVSGIFVLRCVLKSKVF